MTAVFSLEMPQLDEALVGTQGVLRVDWSDMDSDTYSVDDPDQAKALAADFAQKTEDVTFLRHWNLTTPTSYGIRRQQLDEFMTIFRDTLSRLKVSPNKDF